MLALPLLPFASGSKLDNSLVFELCLDKDKEDLGVVLKLDSDSGVSQNIPFINDAFGGCGSKKNVELVASPLVNWSPDGNELIARLLGTTDMAFVFSEVVESVLLNASFDLEPLFRNASCWPGPVSLVAVWYTADGVKGVNGANPFG